MICGYQCKIQSQSTHNVTGYQKKRSGKAGCSHETRLAQRGREHVARRAVVLAPANEPRADVVGNGERNTDDAFGHGRPNCTRKTFDLYASTTTWTIFAFAVAIFALCLFLHLLYLLQNVGRTIEHATCRRTACCALGCPCEALDSTCRAEVVSTLGDDRVSIRLATDEAGKRDILVIRVAIRGFFSCRVALAAWVCG